MHKTNYSTWPSYTDEEADAVANVLLSNNVNYWTGEECRSFESEFAKWSGSDYAIAMANGTVALDVALKALDIGDGDEVIVTSRTFIASASCIVVAGATPVFADIDTDSQNITSESIQKVITPKTKAIICVHLAGWPCEMDSIIQLANDHNLYVIEDCAQAHGATYKGQPVGSIGHIGAWSFCQDKIMTTGGEGGMVTTNDKSLWEKMWSYKDHGKSWDAIYNREHPPGFRWLHESIGTNWRMTEMQAAIGRIQLTRMVDWHDVRKRNSNILINKLSGLDALRIPLPPDYVEHAWYKFYVFIRSEHLKKEWSRDMILQELTDKGVPSFSGSCSEVYLEKAFENVDCRPTRRLENARELGETSLMFLVHPTLKVAEMEQIATIIKQVIVNASI